MSGNRLKALYIFLYMAFATWRVYYNVYLDEQHFTGVQIGIINALIQALIFIVVPVWGIIADKRGIRPTLRFGVLITGLLLLFLGNILNFWVLMVYIVVLTVFYHPLGPLTDALAVQFSQKDEKLNYGKFRMWGSLGWAIASIFGGFLFLYLPLRYIFPLSGLLFFATLMIMVIRRKHDGIIYKPHFELISLKEILSNRPLLIFLIILFLYGIACSPVNAYTNLYFSELGADNSVIGIAYTIQALSEVPFFIIGNHLLKRFGSRAIILISMFIMTVRYFIYAWFPEITPALMVSALQGITFSFLLVGVVDYLHKQLPPSRHATTQSLLWGLYFGLGHTVGNFIIGIIKDISGMVGVMQVFFFITLGIFIITLADLLVYQRIAGKTGIHQG
jgi:MFS transporter, PPP family, 3-phenylpropionic acid transporter